MSAILSVKGIEVAYGTIPALHGIDLEVSPGRLLALVGSSGAGKSTLASLVPRLYDVDEGAVELSGIDVRDLTFAAVRGGRAGLAMIPIENSVAGRVADIHHLMPTSKLHIVAEHFMPVHHQLLGLKSAKLKSIKTVESHIHALGQCRNVIRKLGIKAMVAADTAGSAREVSEAGDPSRASIATRLAASTTEAAARSRSPRSSTRMSPSASRRFLEPSRSSSSASTAATRRRTNRT